MTCIFVAYLSTHSLQRVIINHHLHIFVYKNQLTKRNIEHKKNGK